MDRRDFLKTLGLGGAVLTLPKPLEVVAAVVRDLSGPPLHVAHCAFTDLDVIQSNFLHVILHSMDSGVIADFGREWMVHAVLRRNDRAYVPLVQTPVMKLVSFNCGWGMHGLPVYTPPQDADAGRLVSPGVVMNFSKTDIIEVWIVPTGVRPRRLVPPISAVLSAGGNGDPVVHMVGLPFRQVRLERAKAIEFGLASPGDPYETF